MLGLIVKHFFDRWGKRADRLHARREQESKYKREAYLPFLKELESILAEDAPSAGSIDSARAKFFHIEIDGSDPIILASSMLLQQLEGQARGIKTSHDHLTPTYRKYLLELVRSELHERKPDFKEIEAEFRKDPLYRSLVGLPLNPNPPGTVEVIFDYDARGIKKKAVNEENKTS